MYLDVTFLVYIDVTLPEVGWCDLPDVTLPEFGWCNLPDIPRCDLPVVPWCDLPGVVWCAPPRITPIQRRLHCTFGKRFIIEVLDMEFDISGSFLTHPECNPSDHCFWWSMHLARHWLRSSDGRDSVLYCSHPSVEMSWLATKREEDSIMPDPDPVCPPARLVVVARMRWNNVAWRNLTRWNANGEIFISKGFIIPWMGKQ